MKLTLSILLLSFTSHFVFSQAQIPNYLENGMQWSQHTQDHHNFPTTVTNYNYVYFIQDDTLINSVLYKKLYIRGSYNIQNIYHKPAGDYPNQDQYFHKLSTVIRQDGRKIFMRIGKNQNTIFSDTLIYDFNLAKGDTLADTKNQSPFFKIITDEDSVLIGSEYRKRFIVKEIVSQEGDFYNHYLIEGIGSNNGFLNGYFDNIFSSYITTSLYCFGINNQSLYQFNSGYCDFNVGLKENNSNELFSYFPNPFENEVTLLVPDANAVKTIEVFDIIGNKIESNFSIKSNEISINMIEIESGIYTIRLISKDSSFQTIKVVKK